MKPSVVGPRCSKKFGAFYIVLDFQGIIDDLETVKAWLKILKKTVIKFSDRAFFFS